MPTPLFASIALSLEQTPARIQDQELVETQIKHRSHEQRHDKTITPTEWQNHSTKRTKSNPRPVLHICSSVFKSRALDDKHLLYHLWL
jgi:hypothetical protein